MNRKQLRRMIMERLSISLMEHLTKPDPGSLPLQHIEKINSLIDSEDPAMINQARSLVSALGGPPYYVDEYIDYISVGDIEKLGSQAKNIMDKFKEENPGEFLSSWRHPGVYNTLQDMQSDAMDMARSKSLRDNPYPPHLPFASPGERIYTPDLPYHKGVRTHADRYFDMLKDDDPLNEHRVAPAPHGIPPHHLDKIHDLINRGDLEQAQSLIDAFGGPPNYALDYIAYEEVGDLEKLGNKAADLYDTIPEKTMKALEPVYDIDQEAYDSVNRKIDRGEFTDHPESIDSKYMERYFSNRLRKPVFFEHRVAPVPPNIPQNHLGKIHSLIDSGRLEQAQSLIDAFGGDPSYVDKYIAYEEVGDMEKLGNRAFDIYHSNMSDLDKSTALKDIDIQAINISDERGRRLYGGDQSYIDGGGFTTDMDRYIDNRNRRPDDVLFEHRVLPEPYGIPPQHLDKIHDLINAGELEQAQTLVDAFAGDPDYVYKYRDYMRDRYFNNRNRDLGGNPLNEHNSSRAGLRRMILQEMSSMGIGGQPPMSIDAMIQELQMIESQLEEMEMQREEWIANEARFSGDEVEAAYGYEMEFPDYYDEKEELQSRAYELEEMIEAAGGPSL